MKSGKRAALELVVVIAMIFGVAVFSSYMTQRALRPDIEANAARITRQRQIPMQDTTQTPYKETQVKIYAPGSVEFELGIIRESWTKYYVQQARKEGK